MLCNNERISVWIALAILSVATAKNAKEDALGLTIRCTSESMEMILQREHYRNLDPETFHLKRDKSCRAQFYNDSIIIIKAPLGGCQTRVGRDGTMLKFSNKVVADLIDQSGGSAIAREPAYEFHLNCLYYTTAKITLHPYKVEEKVIVEPTPGIGYFPFQIDMFQTDKYLSPFQSFPVKVHVGERIHLQVKIETNASNLIFLIDNCRATPSKDPNDTRVQQLIKDGCPVESSLNYKASESGYQRFSLTAFRFFSGENDVYLHCEVVVCSKGNASSRCSVDCSEQPESDGRRRKKRDDTALAKNTTTLGPVKILLDRMNVLSPEEGAARSAASTLHRMSTSLLTFTVVCLTLIIRHLIPQ